MKKILAIILTVGLLAAMIPSEASADRGWSVAGKVLTGIIGLHILGHAIGHAAPYPAHYGPPPRAYYPEQVWVPGHYEQRVERRWIPGHWETADRDYDDDDRYDRSEGRRVWVPGHYRDVEVRVWIPGHWEG